jgi:hypothetical protein
MSTNLPESIAFEPVKSLPDFEQVNHRTQVGEYLSRCLDSVGGSGFGVVGDCNQNLNG